MKLERCDHVCEMIRHTNDSKSAWVISRDDKLNDASFVNMNTPVSEFDRVTLRIVTNVLCREVITSLRNHVIWSRTSRVDNYSEIVPICLPERDFDKYKSVLNESIKFVNSIRNSVSQDLWRLHLPLSVRTEFAWNTDRRTLKAVIPFLKKFPVTEELGLVMEKELGPVFGIDFSKEKFSKILPKINLGTNNFDTIEDDLVILHFKASFSLRAQLIRHRYITVSDNLEDFLNSKDFLAEPQSTTLNVRILADPFFFNRIVSHRLCWMAQTSLWSPIISKYISTDTKHLLPCKGSGNCSFQGDQERRLKGVEYDPNPPCPIYCLMNNVKLPEDIILNIKDHAMGRPNLFLKSSDQLIAR